MATKRDTSREDIVGGVCFIIVGFVIGMWFLSLYLSSSPILAEVFGGIPMWTWLVQDSLFAFVGGVYFLAHGRGYRAGQCNEQKRLIERKDPIK